MAHRFSEQEMQAWYDATCRSESAPRQTPARATFSKGQTDATMQRAQPAAMSAKIENSEDWTSERISEYYSARALNSR